MLPYSRVFIKARKDISLMILKYENVLFSPMFSDISETLWVGLAPMLKVATWAIPVY